MRLEFLLVVRLVGANTELRCSSQRDTQLVAPGIHVAAMEDLLISHTRSPPSWTSCLLLLLSVPNPQLRERGAAHGIRLTSQGVRNPRHPTHSSGSKAAHVTWVFVVGTIQSLLMSSGCAH